MSDGIYFITDPLTKSSRPTQLWVDEQDQAALVRYMARIKREKPELLQEGVLIVANPEGGPDFVIREDGTVEGGNLQEVTDLLMPFTLGKGNPPYFHFPNQ